MSRSALAVAGVLIGLGLLAWFLPDAPPKETVDTRTPVAATRQPPATGTPAPGPAVRDSGSRAAKPPTGLPRVGTRAELLDSLEAMALDGEELLAGYRDWRVARGFLGPDTLTGVTADDAPAAQYAGMDRSSLQALADSGDMGAMQAYAAGSLPADPFTALEYYGRASELGSAAAMLEIADVLAGLAGLEDGSLTDPVAARRLQALRRAEPDRDGRLDAAAWNLAAIRQYGPAVAGSSSLGFLAGLARDADPAQLAYACARSLAILADSSAATAGRYGGELPPVFVAEQDLYERLPCRETPAPVMPPGALNGCRRTDALGAGNRLVDLWICPAT